MGSTATAEFYTGETMHSCLITPFDFRNAFAVVVSGASWNPCGHMLLNTGGYVGWYFHIAEVRGRPHFMRANGYQRYLRENGKREVQRAILDIPNPTGAHRKLEELLAKQWTWFLLPNNCASFIEDVVEAGGGKAGLYTNCGRLEYFR